MNRVVRNFAHFSTGFGPTRQVCMRDGACPDGRLPPFALASDRHAENRRSYRGSSGSEPSQPIAAMPPRIGVRRCFPQPPSSQRAHSLVPYITLLRSFQRMHFSSWSSFKILLAHSYAVLSFHVLPALLASGFIFLPNALTSSIAMLIPYLSSQTSELGEQQRR
jgi:hypothetical protein